MSRFYKWILQALFEKKLGLCVDYEYSYDDKMKKDSTKNTEL